MADDFLTTVEANAIVLYSDRCLKVLHLSHWAVILGAEPCRGGAWASIDATDGRYIAMVRVSEDWETFDASRKRSVIMHECIHLIHAQLDDHMRNVLQDNTQISTDLWHAVYTPFKTNCEYMVDGLTTVMRTGGLLPAWPSEKATRKFMKRHGIVDDEPPSTL
jgi:hypothetical protein